MESYCPKSDEYKTNKIKECPYCNAILPLSEYDDHIFCHQIDEQENGQQNNINNFGPQYNNNNYNFQRNNNSSQLNMNHNPYNNSNNNNNNVQNNSNLFQGNNINNQNLNQPNINPESQNKNSINFVDENNNNQIRNIQSNNNNNNNNNNQNNQNNNIPKNNDGSIFDTFKSGFSSFLNGFGLNGSNNQNNNIKNENIPPEQLSEEERVRRNKLEEQRLYEKKILGIVHEDSKVKIEDNRSSGEKISDFIENNSDSILAAVDVIGCLVLHGPSIGRTIVRAANIVGNTFNNFGNHNRNNINNEDNDIIRNNSEIRNKNKDPNTIIKFLPVSEVKEIKQNVEDNDNNNKKCVICLCEFEIGDQVSALPCLHVFHTECIASWIKKHLQCPICKFEVTLKSLIGGFYESSNSGSSEANNQIK